MNYIRLGAGIPRNNGNPSKRVGNGIREQNCNEDIPVSQETYNNNSIFFLLAMVWVEESKAPKMLLVGKELYMNHDNVLYFTLYKVLLYIKFDCLK